jgi:hypothetical protein
MRGVGETWAATSAVGALAAVMVVLVGSSCGGLIDSDSGGGGETAGNPDGCPPAPVIPEQLPERCEDVGVPVPEHGRWDDCLYSPPHMFLERGADYVNDCYLYCVDGRTDVWCYGQGCGGVGCVPVPCDGTPVHGEPCDSTAAPEGHSSLGEAVGNGECVVLGPNADLDAGVIDGLVCACDNPGPIWRCVEVDALPVQ